MKLEFMTIHIFHIWVISDSLEGNNILISFNALLSEDPV